MPTASPRRISHLIRRAWKVCKPLGGGYRTRIGSRLAPQLGVDPTVLQLATESRNYTAVPVDAAIIAEQQQIVEVFYKL